MSKRKLEPKYEPLYKRLKDFNYLDEIVNYKKDYNELKKIKKRLKKKVYPKEPLRFYGKSCQFKAITKRNSQYPGCPIFGQEIIQEKKADRKFFNYFLMSYETMAEIIEKSTYPRFNENINGVSKLCLDIDIDGEKTKVDKQTLINHTNRLYNMIRYINKNIKNDYDIDVKFDPKDPLNSDVKILDASRKGVISFHVIYSNVYCMTVVQAGIYLAKVLNQVLRKNENSFLPLIHFLDFGIYRENHLLRTYYSVKQNKSATRFLLHGLEAQKFDKKVLFDSLISHTPDIKDLECINVESTSNLSDSFHYTQFKYNRNKQNDRHSNVLNRKYKKKSVIIPQRKNINSNKGKKVEFNPNKDAFKKFYEICNKVFKKHDSGFDCRDYEVSKIYLSDFGSQPFQIPGTNITIVRGKSFCIEVNGKYCLLHKRNHDNARTKSFYYFPFSDLIYLEKNKWRKVGEKLVKVKNPKLKNKYIFNLYYRCNFRNVNEGCLKINVQKTSRDLVKEFVEVHNKVLKELE